MRTNGFLRCLRRATDIERKALGVARIVRQKVQPLALHRPACAALDAPHLVRSKNRNDRETNELGGVGYQCLRQSGPIETTDRSVSLAASASGSLGGPVQFCGSRNR
jgi:hypothetical protein